MSKCNIDHSLEDVKNKYESQLQFLPGEISDMFQRFFAKDQEQTVLNEAFHLLKKYDLITPEERSERDVKIKQLIGE